MVTGRRILRRGYSYEDNFIQLGAVLIIFTLIIISVRAQDQSEIQDSESSSVSFSRASGNDLLVFVCAVFLKGEGQMGIRRMYAYSRAAFDIKVLSRD